mgnify:FL=1|tara:strand:+ start:347 stop:538 length:192 start_codon:yes stop_codon:yes gene_type:complete
MKKRAIKIIKNLTSTIKKMEDKSNAVLLAREDMFSTPTVPQYKLKKLKEDLITKYNLKEKEWK